MKKYLIFFSFIFFSTNLYSQGLLINEVMTKNQITLEDEFGDTPDWIELYNNTDTKINLNEYDISDDMDELNKWQLPKGYLGSKEHYLLYASGRDIRESVASWETVADLGDEWLYKIGDSSIPNNWNLPEYNSSNWNSGKSGIGYGDNDDNTIVPNNTRSIYMLRTFYIDNLDNLDNVGNLAIFNIDFDDGYVAYINGVEISRENLGIVGDRPNYNAFANNAIEPRLINGDILPNIKINNLKDILVQGKNVIAVQVHNADSNSSDLTAIPFFSIAFITPPNNARGSSTTITLPEINPHTNFKLSSDGETVLLSKNGVIVDSVTAYDLPSDISYGRQPSGGNSWSMFNIPTPGEANQDTGFQGQASTPQFSHTSQILSSVISLELSTEDPAATIYFTTDGAEPSMDAQKYSSPIIISFTTVIRAIAVEQNKLPSKIATHSFIFEESPQMAIISLSTTPSNFFDYNTGIYVEGPNAQNADPHYGANYWMDWERPIHIDFFEPNGVNAFSIDAGVKIFGAWSRAHDQKSLALFARKKYGEGEIDYKIFPHLDIDKFKSIVLRNSGNDFSYSFIRDPLMQSIVEKRDIDGQAYRPAIVYLNGDYWGIYNIREKLNEDYLESHYGVDPKNVDIIEKHGDVVEGDNEHYFKLYDFIYENDLAVQENYNYVKTLLDISNFQDYFISQIYFNNQDWPGNNLKYWREKGEDGKFRLLLYDTDFGFGLYNSNDFTVNTLSFATTPYGADWPNPPWSTLFLRKLLENKEFKNQFITKFSLFLSTNLSPEKVSHTIDSLYTGIASEMPEHCNRWGSYYNSWDSQRDVLRYFGSQRPYYCRQFIRNYFDLGEMHNVSIAQKDYAQGNIYLYNQKIDAENTTGSFFKDVPLEIVAVPKPEYKFKGWTGTIESKNAKLLLYPVANVSLTAEFEPYSDNEQPIVINEINYHSSESFDSGDWLELYNRSDEDINIKDYKITDSDYNNSFAVAGNYNIDAKGYLVICQNIDKFKQLFPNIENVIGNFDFNLSNGGESISLYDKNGNLVDIVEYSDSDPWPDEAYGDGATLSLISPTEDNNQATNWGASIDNGTPGKINDIVNGFDDHNYQQIFTYQLEQNYPNPFNPVTTINYQISTSGNVQLVIYDLLGRKIKTLVNEVQMSGSYSVSFDASQLSSGVYIYKISSGDFISSKKMVLLK